jgi:hypothetical protein
MTQYTDAGVEALLCEQPEVLDQLQRATEHALQQSALAANERAKEHLRSGVGRRLRVLHRALSNMFELFPPSAIEPIDRDALDDAQINLHAFIMNLYGLFDNLAWAFVLHHNLLSLVADRKKVGFFLGTTKRFFPPAVRAFADDAKMNTWHGDYLKNFRDALAHRIAPYIPPATYAEEDEAQYNALEHQWQERVRARDWARADDISRRQASLGSPCFAFVHSFDPAEGNRIVYLHPQMIADAKTALEVCTLFFANWQQRAL